MASLQERVVGRLVSEHGFDAAKAARAWVLYAARNAKTVANTERNEVELKDDYSDTLADDIVSWGGGARGFGD